MNELKLGFKLGRWVHFMFSWSTFCYLNLVTSTENKENKYVKTALTLYFYNNEPSKNKRFLILLSSLARYSQEPRLKRIFEILWVLFEKISVFYSDLPKSWIWWTLGHVSDIFFVNFIFIMIRKKFFVLKSFWISYTGSNVPFWQNWKIAKMALLNPCMEFKMAQRLWSVMKMTYTIKYP